MLGVVLSAVLAVLQGSQTGAVVGTVKLPNGAKPSQAAHAVLLPPKYIEVWNRQVQQRLDNYWEAFKPEFAVHKERFMDFYRMAHVESLRFVVSTMRRELGDESSKLVKDASPTGQFEFRGVPFGSYQLLVQTVNGGAEIVWSQAVEVQSDIPIFVDLGKPVS